MLNDFVASHSVKSVIEFGCGDGNQLSLAQYPTYLAFDVSTTAVAMCRDRFRSDSTKTFRLMNDYAGERADLALSLDVIYHLVENDVFEHYMRTLFGASTRFVIVFSSDAERPTRPKDVHVRHRPFTPWLREHFPEWKPARTVPNRHPFQGDNEAGSFADFFIYERL